MKASLDCEFIQQIKNVFGYVDGLYTRIDLHGWNEFGSTNW